MLVEEASLFPENIEVGMSFERVTDDGEEEIVYRITDVAEGKVVVDGNHPWRASRCCSTSPWPKCARRPPRR